MMTSLNRLRTVLAVVLAFGATESMTCREREVALGRIDEATALPIARPQWERAKLLALRLHTAEGSRVFLLGLVHSISKGLGNNPDAAELSTICSVWGPIWAQIVYGRMTNRVYEGLKGVFPCGW